jgi:hypothetical protein
MGIIEESTVDARDSTSKILESSRRSFSVDVKERNSKNYSKSKIINNSKLPGIHN